MVVLIFSFRSLTDADVELVVDAAVPDVSDLPGADAHRPSTLPPTRTYP